MPASYQRKPTWRARSRPSVTPSHARRRGIKYHYYISSALLQGRPKQAGTVNRIPAHEIETLVIKAFRNHLNDWTELADRLLIQNHVTRVEVQSDQLVIELLMQSVSDQSASARAAR